MKNKFHKLATFIQKKLSLFTEKEWLTLSKNYPQGKRKFILSSFLTSRACNSTPLVLTVTTSKELTFLQNKSHQK